MDCECGKLATVHVKPQTIAMFSSNQFDACYSCFLSVMKATIGNSFYLRKLYGDFTSFDIEKEKELYKIRLLLLSDDDQYSKTISSSNIATSSTYLGSYSIPQTIVDQSSTTSPIF